MARRRVAPPPATVTGVPPEVASQLHPLWRDAEALAAHPVFSEFVDEHTQGRLEMGARVYHVVVRRWAVANGYESSKYPGFVDEHRLRADMEAAGLDVPPSGPRDSGNGRMILPPEPGAR